MQCGPQKLYNVFYTCPSHPVIFQASVQLRTAIYLILMRCLLVHSLLSILHASWLMAFMMMALNHTSSLAFLGCFSITSPKMFFLTVLCVAKDLSFEIVEIKVVKSLLYAMTFCSLQRKSTAPFRFVSRLCSSVATVQHSNIILTLSLCISRSVGL